MFTGLYSIKPWFVRRLAGMEDLLVARGVGADAVTLAAAAAGLTAGATIVVGATLSPRVWLLFPVAALVRLALNALDGSIARRTGTARPYGTALNEVADRVADAGMIASLLAVAPCWVVVPALASASIASTSGLAALAATGRRDSSGPMGKADRALVLSLAAVAAGVIGSTVPFVVAAVVIGAGGVATTAGRMARLHTKAVRS